MRECDDGSVGPADVLPALNRLFVRSVLELGRAGQLDAASRLAGEGWALLRHDYAREAERLNAVMHSLTRVIINPP